MTTNAKSAGIIGAGISGLTTGFALMEKGIDVTIYEKNSFPGGVIKSIRKDGWLVELGPNTIMSKQGPLWNLVQKLGLDVLTANECAKKRFIVKNGIPQALPASLKEFIATDILSAKAKFRLFKEPFISKADKNESVAVFFERRLGKEAVDYAVNPFVGGIYAGDPQRLSIKHAFATVYELEQTHGSLLKGAVKTARQKKLEAGNSAVKGLISFKEGIQQLANTLSQRMESSIKFDCEISRIQKTEKGWTVEGKDEYGSFHHDAVIFTAPSHQLPFIRFGIGKAELLEVLSGIGYAPIATVAMGFKRSQVKHPLNGFGMLVPEVEPFNILGCLFSSSLFDGRCPEDHVLLTSFAGGERNPELAEKTEKEITKLVLHDLDALLGITGDAAFELAHTRNRAIPQYGLDHSNYLDCLEQLERANPGLLFTGNFREEVSVPGCISKAYETAGAIASFLQS